MPLTLQAHFVRPNSNPALLCAGPLFATIFFEEVRSICLRMTEKRFVADKGTSEGAAVPMNKPSQYNT
jgi:hypothetical protein